MATNQQDFLARLNSVDTLIQQRSREEPEQTEPGATEASAGGSFADRLARVDAGVRRRRPDPRTTRFAGTEEAFRRAGVGADVAAAELVAAENIRRGRTGIGTPTIENAEATEALRGMDPAERAALAEGIARPRGTRGDLSQGDPALAEASELDLAIARGQAFHPLVALPAAAVETAGTLGSYLFDPAGMLAGPAVRRGIRRRAALREAVIADEGEGRGLETIGTAFSRLGGQLLTMRAIPVIGQALSGSTPAGVAARPIQRALAEGAAAAGGEGLIALTETGDLEEANRRIAIGALFGGGVGSVAGLVGRRAARARAVADATRSRLVREQIQRDAIQESVEESLRAQPRQLPPGRPGTPPGAIPAPGMTFAEERAIVEGAETQLLSRLDEGGRISDPAKILPPAREGTPTGAFPASGRTLAEEEAAVAAIEGRLPGGRLLGPPTYIEATGEIGEGVRESMRERLRRLGRAARTEGREVRFAGPAVARPTATPGRARQVEVDPTSSRGRLAESANPPKPTPTQILARPIPHAPGRARTEAVHAQAADLSEAVKREIEETAAPLGADEIRGEPPPGTVLDRPRPAVERRARLRQRLSDPETLRAENAALRQQLESAAIDELTGLPGQNAWRKAATRLDADPETEIVSLDMANLKAANDRVSPSLGDERLRDLSVAMRKVADQMGIPTRNLFRRGGDEFAAAVPRGMGEEFARRVEVEYGAKPVAGTRFENFVRAGVGRTARSADDALNTQKGSGPPGIRDAPEDPTQGRLFAGVPTGFGRALTARSGGTVVGAVAGGQVGAREAEERGANPALGALFGGVTGAAAGFAAGSGAARAVRSRAIRRNFTVQGLLPRDIFDRKVLRDAQVRSLLQQIRFTTRDFNRAVAEAYGSVDNVTADEWVAVDKVLKGEAAPATIPPALRPVVNRMRLEIDALSQRLIDEGIVSGDLAARVSANKGLYTTRAYQVFDDPRWLKKVDPAVVNKAKAWLRAENPTATDEQIQGTIDKLLNVETDSPLGFLRGGTLGSKDLSILRKRGDIAPEIRALWGEIKDPVLNYTRSVEKMVRLLENESFLREVRQDGLGKIFFEQPVTNADGQFIERIAAEGSDRMAPLNGLYTTPEIAIGFRDAVEGLPERYSWVRAYLAVNAAVKFNKTVGSLMTHVRNTVGNVGFAVANGHWRLAHSAKALQTTLTSLGLPSNLLRGRGGVDSAASREFYKKMQALGVINESANVGELADAIRDFTHKSDVDLFDALPVRFSGRLRPAARATGTALRTLQDLYRAEDDVWKIYAWLNETSRLRKALPNAPMADLEARAASIVRDTYPTYSLVPRGIRALRRFPLLGTFVSFPAEVVRTSKNVVQLAFTELRDPNPAIRAIGAQRLAGIMVAAGGTAVAAKTSQFVNGITPDEDEYIREMGPPWSQNSQLFYLNKGPDGTYEYVDIGYSDPYSYAKKVVIAAMRGESIEDAAIAAGLQAAEPFLGEDIMTSKLLDIARNRRRGTTSTVFNPEDSFERKTLAIMGHLWDALEPGTITSAQRIMSGLQGEANVYGQAYDPRVEATAVFTGQRRTVLDPVQALQFKAREFSRRKADATSILTRTITSRGEVSDRQIELAFRSMLDARMRNYTDIIRALEGTQVYAGIDRAELYSILRSSQISEEESAYLLNGMMPPLEVSNQSMANLINAQLAGLEAGPETDARVQRTTERLRLWLTLVNDANRQQIPSRFEEP